MKDFKGLPQEKRCTIISHPLAKYGAVICQFDEEKDVVLYGACCYRLPLSFLHWWKQVRKEQCKSYTERGEIYPCLLRVFRFCGCLIAAWIVFCINGPGEGMESSRRVFGEVSLMCGSCPERGMKKFPD